MVFSEPKPDQEPISECITGLVVTLWCYQHRTEPEYIPNRHGTEFLKYPNGAVFSRTENPTPDWNQTDTRLVPRLPRPRPRNVNFLFILLKYKLR